MKHICLVAGGTGGHIIPALVFGEWVKTHRKEVSVSFVCGSRTLEKEIYEAAEVRPVILPLSGSPFGIQGLSGKAKRWKDIARSFNVFRSFLRDSNIDMCILFGGYVSFIPLLLSHFYRVPLIVHEQNSVAGKITRLSAILGKKIASGWNVCAPLSSEKFTRTGIPVRRFVLQDRSEAWKRLGLGVSRPQEPIIGVLGGSLMSQRLIQLLCPVFQTKELESFSFLVLGVSQNDIEKAYSGNLKNVLFVDKQWDMSSLYSVVDAVVTRGGASTLFELASLGIPAIVVPWKDAADNHQKSNARAFLEINDGALWHEDDPPEALKECILRILRNEKKPCNGFAEGDESEVLWRLISSSVGREII